MPDSWTPLLIALVGMSVFLYGISKTTMPVAGAVAGPLLVAALGAPVAAGFVLPLLIVGDVFAVVRFRQHADWPLIIRLVPGVLVGIAIASLLFIVVDTATLGRIVGVLILLSVVLEVWRRRTVDLDTDPQRHWASAAFFGALAGMTTMAANAGGAAMTMYLIKMRVAMLAFMGTSAWFFFFVNVLKVPFVVGLGFVTRESLLAALWFLPVLLAGAVVGMSLFRRMNERVFTAIALTLSAAASAWLIIHG